LLTGLMMTVVLTVLLGLLYPLAVTGVAQAAFRSRADGTLLTVNGKAVGSALIGQAFSDAGGNPLPQYFQPRPSAAGKRGYDPTSSGGTNLGPSNPSLLKSVSDRVGAFRSFNGLGPGTPVPVDAVTSSGSGLDPDISPANAYDQVARVAHARGLEPAAVRHLVDAQRNGRAWGFLGEDTVNVVDLNIALDRMGR